MGIEYKENDIEFYKYRLDELKKQNSELQARYEDVLTKKKDLLSKLVYAQSGHELFKKESRIYAKYHIMMLKAFQEENPNLEHISKLTHNVDLGLGPLDLDDYIEILEELRAAGEDI